MQRWSGECELCAPETELAGLAIRFNLGVPLTQTLHGAA
jgi:hypothetical protein